MAIACLRLFTFLPLRPIFKRPRLNSCISRSTFFPALGLYLRRELDFLLLEPLRWELRADALRRFRVVLPCDVLRWRRLLLEPRPELERRVFAIDELPPFRIPLAFRIQRLTEEVGRKPVEFREWQ